MVNLIKELNDGLQPKDAYQEAVDLLEAKNKKKSDGTVHTAKGPMKWDDIKADRKKKRSEQAARRKKKVAEGMEDPTHLDDEQVVMLADYMKEMMDDAKVRGGMMDIKDAAGMALEDVAGFESAPNKVLQATVARLMKAYIAKYGNS